ncbi:MAG: hypothetical protein AAF399_04960 [Bacteroidota bacterium]
MKPTLSFLSLLLVSLLLACKSGQTVVQTPAPAVPPAAPIPKDLSPAELSRLYSDGLMNCYPYMFSELVPGLEVHDQQLGLFLGGLKGMLLYSGLPEAVVGHLRAKGVNPGTNANDFYDIHKYEQLAGGKQAFQGGEQIFESFGMSGSAFHAYRPEIVRWGYENLIPDPSSQIAGMRAQDLYQQVFARFFRLLAESYVWLEKHQGKAEEQRYQQQFDQVGFDGLAYLEERFADKLPLYETNDAAESFTPAVAIGFWLRRGLDGSQADFWEGLSRVMLQYDQQWFVSLTN